MKTAWCTTRRDPSADVPFSSHLKWLGGAVLVWAVFWVAGWPSYYQQYSFTFLAVGTAALVPPSAWLGWKSISSARAERRLALGFWLSLYFTVPLFLLDWLYCGVYLGEGAGYFAKYWYLTVFYFVPWVLFIPMGLWAGSRSKV